MKIAHILIVILIVIVGTTTYWSLFQKNRDNTLFYELRGITHDLGIADLCDSSPFAGVEGHTTNVASRRMTSVFYSIPTALLYDSGIPLHLIHRGINFVLFIATMILLYFIAQGLELSLPVRWLLVIYYGLSEQVLMPLFTSQIVTSAIFWFVLVLFLYLKFLKSSPTKPKLILLWLGLLALTLFAGYETYIVARPLALMILLYVGAQILFFERRVKLIVSVATLIIFSVFGWGLLQLAHPELSFDLVGFRGVGESIVTWNSSSLRGDSAEYVKKRVNELSLLFDRPERSYIGAWWPVNRTTGWLDVWVLLVPLLIFHAVALYQYPRLRKRRSTAATYLLFLFFCGSVALLIPLASITGIRGHRLFALYSVSSIGLAILLDRALVYAGSSVRRKAYVAIFVLGCILLWNQSVVIAQFSPLAYDTRTAALNQQLLEIREQLSRDREMYPARNNSSYQTEICNQGNRLTDGGEFTEQVAWTYVLYASGFGCRMHVNKFKVMDCTCNERVDKQVHPLKPTVCINRASDNSIEVHRKNLR